MLDLTLIMLGAGSSTRFKMPVKKQWIRLGDDPLWLYVTKNISSFYDFKDIFIVSNDCEYMEKFTSSYKFISGGNTRQQSLKNALNRVKTEFVLVSDVARPFISIDLFNRLINKAGEADCIIPVLAINDSVYFDENPINREKLNLIQTPQLSKTEILKLALEKDEIYTDDSSAIISIGGKVIKVLGDEQAKKITTKEDLLFFNFKSPSNDFFVGNGFDVHEFAKGYDFYLCGEKIDYEYGLKAHSDGDVAIHSIIDAMLGACALGDIGELYPDTDDNFKNIRSTILLKDVYKKILGFGFELVNLDLTIIAQSPKLSNLKNKMRYNLAEILNLSQNRINIKATTTEKLGFIGRKEGIAVLASVNLKYYDWTQK